MTSATNNLVETATEEELLDESPRTRTEVLPSVVIAAVENERKFKSEVFSISDFPSYVPEEQNPNILIKGRWLERGGSAWWVSTAGTGKSIASVQVALSWGAGIGFANLNPHRPITTWVIQSEDSPSRITIDREDIIAELTEQRPDIDWRKIANERVFFVDCKENCYGTNFFREIGRLLDTAKLLDEQHEGEDGYIRRMPDLLIINPFLAFVGGPITDSSYVTPFLRGGLINNEPCEGFQPFLERFNIAALIFHHTPKPPSESEIKSWLSSTFPEYQGAGSSDITNWGRSFITMMKCPNHPRVVCLCAGKNGGEIGWEQIGGSTRHYLAWSESIGITGGGRHAWRELNENERAEIVEKQKNEEEKSAEADAKTIAQVISELRKAYVKRDFRTEFNHLMTKRRAEEAGKILFANPRAFGLIVRNQKNIRGNNVAYISASESAILTAAKHSKESERMKVKYDSVMAQSRENKPNVAPVEPTVEPTTDNYTNNSEEDYGDYGEVELPF